MTETDLAQQPPETALVLSGEDAVADARPPRLAVRSGRAERVRRAVGVIVRQPGLVVSILLLAVVVLAAWDPGLFTHRDPIAQDYPRLSGPSAAHWFGTDDAGRDIYARVVHGASASVKAVVVAVIVGLFVGSGLGLLAAWVGRLVDDIVMRVIDVLLSVPALLIALAFFTALGFGTIHIAIAVGIGNIASFARVMRAEVLRIKAFGYVEAAKFSGISRLRIVTRHVVPNALGPVFVLATLEVGLALLNISSLSFLGFGAPPPAPEWGSLVASGRDFLGAAWWMTTMPGLVVALTVLAANRVARSLEGNRAVAP